jgi:hypothetical protein
MTICASWLLLRCLLLTRIANVPVASLLLLLMLLVHHSLSHNDQRQLASSAFSAADVSVVSLLLLRMMLVHRSLIHDDLRQLASAALSAADVVRRTTLRRLRETYGHTKLQVRVMSQPALR